jgi:hypothetical protein
MFPPAGTATFTTERGQVLNGTTNGYLDVVTQDADALEHAGWTRVCEIGPTASRPTLGPASDLGGKTVTLKGGYTYFDTTLTKTIFWSASKKIWVDQTHSAV